MQIIKVPNGQTVDLWTGVNISGDVHLAIRSRGGENRMNLWWVTWGVGSIQNVGTWGPDGTLPIPIRWWKGIVSAKLRGSANADTVVYLSDQVLVDKSFNFIWP